MKKLSIFLISFLAMLVLVVSPALAASLQVTNLGTTDVSSLDLGGALKTYTYSGGTFELAGTASPSAVVSIVIDDVTKTATSDSLGNWSSLISSLSTGNHDFAISSNTESLDFILTVGSSTESATGTGGTTTTASTSSTSTTTLPEAGSLSTSIFTLFLAMLSLGLGTMLANRKA